MTTTSAYDVVHYVIIKVYGSRREIVEVMRWDGLLFGTRTRFDWYFKYRAALLQVKYPRLDVVMTWGSVPATGRSLDHIRQSKIRALKSKLTKYRNLVKAAEDNWDSLFPIEDDMNYRRATDKIRNLEIELNNHENKY